MPTFCPQCGAEAATEAVYCHKCGVRLAADGVSEPAASDALPKADDPRPSPTASRDEASSASSSPAERFRRSAGQTGNDDDERELWEGTYSSQAMVGIWVVAALVSLAVFIAAITIGFSGTGWMITVVGILVAWAILYLWLVYRQLSVHYRLTSQRFVHERGILRRVTDRIEVIDVDDVAFEQGPIERLLGIGTIRITSSDRTHPEISLPGIAEVRDVATLLDDARRDERRRRGLYVEAV